VHLPPELLRVAHFGHIAVPFGLVDYVAQREIGGTDWGQPIRDDPQSLAESRRVFDYVWGPIAVFVLDALPSIGMLGHVAIS
jgi:hypothetical protein